jgi:molybdopterin synthase sulfur carrier subunit
MSVTVRIPAPLRRITNGVDIATVDGSTLFETLANLEVMFPGIRERLTDETGGLRHFVNIYINGEDVRFLSGLDTQTNQGDEVSIVPAVAGGARL